MRSFWQLSPQHHSGRLAPHHHTSYPALIFLLLLMAVVLASFTLSASAADEYVIPGPHEGLFTVHASVSAPAPKEPPILEGVSNGQVISEVPVTVNGRCPATTLVKVFKNEIVAGAVLCSKDKRYTLPIDLFLGENRLVARAFNTVEKVSPDSNVVTVTYTPKADTGLTNSSAPQLRPDTTPASRFFIKSDVFHRGYRPGQETKWPLVLVGGTAPYAISVAWGDKKTDVYSRGVAGPFEIKHIYDKPGNGYRGQQEVIIKASDATGATTYLQVVTLVNDTSAVTALTSMPTGLQVAWPLLIVAVLMVACFLLGEWREKRVMRRKLNMGAA